MAFENEIIIADGVTSTGLVAAPEEQGGSALTITVEAGGELAQGVAKAGGTIHGAMVDSHLDHRIAMSLAIAGLAAADERRESDALY